jgi:hypothetical protein
MSYQDKYLKYKQKYLMLKRDVLSTDTNFVKLEQIGGTLGLCQICKQEKDLRKCTQCKYVTYCSRECQIADWHTHKTKCKKIAKATEQIVNPEDLKSTNPAEFDIRTRAVDAILEFYSILNTKFDFSSGIISYKVNYVYPGFNRFPLPASEIIRVNKRSSLNHHFMQLEMYPVPLFNKTSAELAQILRFETISEVHPNHIMDCTNAFGMTQFAIMHKLIPDYTIQLLNNTVLDQVVIELIKQNPLIRDVNGYHRAEEIKKLQYYYKNGILTDDKLSGINNVLLNPQKDKRLFVIHTYRQDFFTQPTVPTVPTVPTAPTKYNIGNGYGISGHPYYFAGIMGNHPSENVFCVGFTSEAEPRFMGFSGNKSNRPGIRPICDFSNGPQPLSVIQHFLAVEYVKGLFVLDSIDRARLAEFPKEIIDISLHILGELRKILGIVGNITDEQLEHPKIIEIIADAEKIIKSLPIITLAILNIDKFIRPFTLPEIDPSKIEPDNLLQSDMTNEELIAEIKKKL